MARKKLVEMPAREQTPEPVVEVPAREQTQEPVVIEEAAVVPMYELRADRPGDIERLLALRSAGFAGLEGILREFELYSETRR